jgi:hypothetical protein
MDTPRAASPRRLDEQAEPFAFRRARLRENASYCKQTSLLFDIGMQRGQTVQICKNNRCLCLRALVLALLATLALAGAASAETTTAGGGAAEGQESGSGPPQETEQQPEGAEGAQDKGGEDAATTPTDSETPTEPPAEVPPVEVPAVEVPPVEVPVVEVPPVEVPPVEVPPVEVPPVEVPAVVEPAEPAPAEAPAGAPPPEAEAAGAAPPESSEETKQTKAAGDSEEAGGSGAPPLHPTMPTSEQTLIGDASAHPALAGASTAGGPPASITAQVAELGGPGGPSSPATRKGATTTAKAAGQVGGYRCELSSLSGSIGETCTAGWLGGGGRVVEPMPTVAAVAAVSSLFTPGAPPGPPAGGGHGAPSFDGPPLTPSPGSAPSGVSGGAAGGAAGAGVSLFLTLAGLLLLGAPRVLRRLRLSFEPWLAGCFVLIPEHPD